MSAPNRSDVVKRVLEQHAHAVHVSEAELEDRRRRFLPAFIAEMPMDERGNWGVLLKTDRNPAFIPSDILVWRPTMEHIDCLTALEALDGNVAIVPIWINHGVIGVAPGTKNKVGVWIWLDVTAANIPPLPAKPDAGNGGTTGEEPGDDDAEKWERDLLESLARIVDGIDGIRVAAETIALVAKRFS